MLVIFMSLLVSSFSSLHLNDGAGIFDNDNGDNEEETTTMRRMRRAFAHQSMNVLNSGDQLENDELIVCLLLIFFYFLQFRSD